MIVMQHMQADGNILNARDDSQKGRGSESTVEHGMMAAGEGQDNTEHLKRRCEFTGKGRLDIDMAFEHENNNDTDQDNKIA